MSVEPEERIDLSSEDAVERLDRIHDDIAARRPHDPERVSDASEEVTEEDERELEETHAFSDMLRREMEEDHSPAFRLERESASAARDLLAIAAEGKLAPEEVAGIAKRFAARLASEHEAFREACRKEGRPPGAAASERELYERLMRAYDDGRGLGKEGMPQETRRIEPPLGQGEEGPEDDDVTGERAA